MSVPTGAARYAPVNTQWPSPVPALTFHEAAQAAKRLWRRTTKTKLPWRIVETSGNRESWTRTRAIDPRHRKFARYGIALVLNPEKGWRDLVHTMSHLIHRRLEPGERPHSAIHFRLERDLVDYVVNESGWLQGKLKSRAKPKTKPTGVEVRDERHKRVLARIKSWEAKRRRAETALKKLAKQRRYYEKTIARVDELAEAA